MNDQLKKVLDDNGIKESKNETLNDVMGGHPLKELFDYFGQIFGPQFDIDRQKNYDDAKDTEDES